MGEGDQEVHGDGNLVVGRDLTVTLPRVARALPLHMVRVIRKLDEMVDEQARRDYGKPSEVEEKLAFNEVVRFKSFILEYGTYGHVVEGAYQALNNSEPGISQRVTRFIRSLYKGIETRKPALSSDDILQQLISTLYERAGDVPDVPAEEIEPSCNMLVAHAFLNCTVLKGVA